MSRPGAVVKAEDKLTLHEVALELARSLEQVRRYVREGKLPAEKLGMRWFVDRATMEAFKAATRGTPPRRISSLGRGH